MSSIETSEERRLSPEEKDLATLFKLSYRYSQGNSELQGYIFTWLIQHGYIDPANLPEEIPTSLATITPPKSHTPTSPEGRVEDVKQEWETLRTLKPFPNDTPYVISALTERFIERDLNFTERNIRPNRNPNGIVLPDNSNDPHASFTRKYILQQHPAGHEAFNIMFGEVNTSISQLEPDGETMRKLRRLGESWEKHHPGESFYSPATQPTPTPLLQEA